MISHTPMAATNDWIGCGNLISVATAFTTSNGCYVAPRVDGSKIRACLRSNPLDGRSKIWLMQCGKGAHKNNRPGIGLCHGTDIEQWLFGIDLLVGIGGGIIDNVCPLFGVVKGWRVGIENAQDNRVKVV